MNGTIGIAEVIDIVLAITLLECVALLVWHRATGKGVAPRDWLLNMVSGLCLMLALRCLARDSGNGPVALFLLAAGLSHGADTWMRWRRTHDHESARRVTA